MAEVREAAAAETARAEECVAAAASEEKLAEAGAAEAGAAEAEAWVEAEVARQEAATATAEVQVLVRRAAALQAQLAGTLAGTQAERRARAQQLSASAMHAASLTSQVEALEAELGRTEERGRAVVHARDDARREAAEAAHACAQLTQRAWAVAPRLLRLLPPPAEAALSGVLVAPSAAMAPWGALEGALGRAEEEGGWRTEAEVARAAEARRAAQKASTSLQAEAARRSRLHVALAEEQETSGALRLELHGERELRLRLQAELGGEARSEARGEARGEAHSGARSCGARGACDASAHNAAAMLECAQRVAAESDARDVYHVERRQEARCYTHLPTQSLYTHLPTNRSTYLPTTSSADLITVGGAAAAGGTAAERAAGRGQVGVPVAGGLAGAGDRRGHGHSVVTVRRAT